MKRLMWEVDNSAIIAAVSIDKTTRQKINKEMEELNNTLNQLALTDIQRTLHPTTTEHTFFPSTHCTFSRIAICYAIKQTSINFKRLKIQSVFSNHNGMKVEIKNRRKCGKFTTEDEKVR